MRDRFLYLIFYHLAACTLFLVGSISFRFNFYVIVLWHQKLSHFLMFVFSYVFCCLSDVQYLPLQNTWQPSRHMVPKWRRIDVDKTQSCRIDVNTTSFYVICPLGRLLLSLPWPLHCYNLLSLDILRLTFKHQKMLF